MTTVKSICLRWERLIGLAEDSHPCSFQARGGGGVLDNLKQLNYTSVYAIWRCDFDHVTTCEHYFIIPGYGSQKYIPLKLQFLVV